LVISFAPLVEPARVFHWAVILSCCSRYSLPERTASPMCMVMLRHAAPATLAIMFALNTCLNMVCVFLACLFVSLIFSDKRTNGLGLVLRISEFKDFK